MISESGEIIGPYRILRRLGEGGMGVVDLAADTQTGNRVALKRLSRVSGGLLDALKREVRTLATLNHPNIVKIFDHDLNAEVPWYAMEFVGETSLRDRLQDGPQLKTLADSNVTQFWEKTLFSVDARTLLVKGAPIDELGPLSLPGSVLATTRPWLDLLKSMTDVCAGLSALHSAGIVHRDLKPENILFRDDNSAVIVDFGISVHAEGGARERLTRSLRASGTPAYLSPEQVLSRPLDARSDLYSLGIILFEILTGRVPFDHSTLIRVLQDHVYTVPPNICALNSEVSVFLGDLVASLVSKEPHQRIGFAIDVDRALRRVLEMAPPEYKAPLYTYAPRWVGREDALNRLTNMAHEVSKRGLGRVVHICGETGIGKTRLVNEMIQSVAHNVPVHVGFGVRESSRPFKAFAIVWSSMADDDQDAARRMQREYQDWWDAVSQRSRPLTWEDVQIAYNVLTSIATDTPRIVVVDDAQWVDPWSAMLIERLIAEPPSRLGLLLVSRDEPEGVQIDCPDRIELERLSQSEVKDVVMSMIGVSSLADTYSDFAWRETNGNPLLLVELVHSVMRAGVLRRDEAGIWHIAKDRSMTPSDLPISERVASISKAEFERVKPDVQRALEVAASLGVVVDFQVLKALTDVSQRAIVDSGILVADGKQLRFKNSLLAREIYRGIVPSRRETLHRMIAEFLETHTTNQNPFALGKHFSKGGLLHRAAPYHWQAHGRARQAGNFAESIRQFHFWIRASDEPRPVFWEKVFTVLERDFVMSGGVFIEICELLQTFAEHESPGIKALVLSYRIRACFVEPESLKRAWLEEAYDAARQIDSQELGLHLKISERYIVEDHRADKLPEILGEIVEVARNIGPVQYVKALIDLSSDRIFKVDYATARQSLKEAEAVASDLLPAALQNRLKVCRAMLEGESGQYEMALKVYEEVLVAHRRSGSDRDVCLTLWNIANQLSSLGRYAESYEVLQEAETISSFAPYFQLRAIVVMLQATMAGNLGNCPEALNLFRRAESIFNHPENRGVRLYGHFKVLQSSFLRRLGRWEEAEEALPELGREPFLDVCILAEQGFTLLASGHCAAQEIERMETIVADRRFQPTSKPGRLLAALKASASSSPDGRFNGERVEEIPPLLLARMLEKAAHKA